MKKYNAMKALCLILIIYTLLFALPISSLATEYNPALSVEEEASYALSNNVKVGSRIWELLFGDKRNADEACQLVPGGQVFGMKIKQKYVTVVESPGVPALKSGDIILMHEIYENSYQAFSVIIDTLYKEGYRFVTVSELLGESIQSGTKYHSLVIN